LVGFPCAAPLSWLALLASLQRNFDKNSKRKNNYLQARNMAREYNTLLAVQLSTQKKRREDDF